MGGGWWWACKPTLVFIFRHSVELNNRFKIVFLDRKQYTGKVWFIYSSLTHLKLGYISHKFSVRTSKLLPFNLPTEFSHYGPQYCSFSNSVLRLSTSVLPLSTYVLSLLVTALSLSSVLSLSN